MKPTTKAMIQSHELHHADYRDWCDHCRAGKGVSHQHRSSTNDNEEADFSIDCAFMTQEGTVEMDRSKAVWAMATNMKGPTDSAVKWLTRKMN